jgi:hypothetical protein
MYVLELQSFDHRITKTRDLLTHFLCSSLLFEQAAESRRTGKPQQHRSLRKPSSRISMRQWLRIKGNDAVRQTEEDGGVTPVDGSAVVTPKTSR